MKAANIAMPTPYQRDSGITFGERIAKGE